MNEGSGSARVDGQHDPGGTGMRAPLDRDHADRRIVITQIAAS